MEVQDMMTVNEEQKNEYVYHFNGRTLRLDKNMVDRYSKFVCPLDEEYIDYLVHVFDNEEHKDSILSYEIALGMTRELSGFEYAR